MNVLLIGQGYAGSLLAWMLISEGVKVTVVDSCPEFSSTKVAAGIMIPVTGRRLAKTYLADSILPFAMKTYRQIEKAADHTFFVEKDVLQIFSSAGNLNEWYARSSDPEMDGYCGNILSREQVHPSISGDFGGIELKKGGYVEPLAFLESVKDIIKREALIVETELLPGDLIIHDHEVTWMNRQYSHAVFCEGFHAMKNPYFSYLPFKPAKGEILDFISNDLSDTYIISSGVYILPLGSNKFRTGATYAWNDLSENTTEPGYRFLAENLRKAIRCDFEITGHKAGIRPAIRDRRPLVGFHPLQARLGILNGLGTKGAMLGPYYANQMKDLILSGTKPDHDVNVNRFDALCQGTSAFAIAEDVNNSKKRMPGAD